MKRLFIYLFFSVISLPVEAMDLTEAYQLALQNDQGWKVAQAEHQMGIEVLPQAEALLLPQVTLSGSKSRVQLKETRSGVQLDDRHYGSDRITFNATQTLFDRSKQAQLQQAQAQVDESNARLRLQKGELLDRVTSAYFNVLLAEATQAQLVIQEKAYRAQADALDRSYQLGNGTRTDVDEAKARLNLIEAQLLQARQQVVLAKIEFQSLVGEEVSQLTTPSMGQIEQVSMEQSLALRKILAEESSSELKAIKANIAAAEASVEAARSANLPVIDLFLQRSISGSDSVTSVGSKYDSAQIGVQLNLSLYDGGTRPSKLREALSSVEMNRSRLEQATKQLHLNLQREYQNVHQGKIRTQALQKGVCSAQQVVLSVAKGITAGVRTTVDWLNAQQQVSDAIMEMQRAYYETLLAVVRMESLTGKTAQEIVEMVSGLVQAGVDSENQLPCDNVDQNMPIKTVNHGSPA